MKLSVMAMLLVLACTSANSDAPKTPWKIELTTSGGIAGRGNGNIAIASDRNVTVRTMDGKECTFTATAEEVDRIATLLGDAKPEQWSASYAPENRCCDRIGSVLAVDEAGTKHETEWIDDPLPMPANLTALADGVVALRGKYLEKCR